MKDNSKLLRICLQAMPVSFRHKWKLWFLLTFSALAKNLISNVSYVIFDKMSADSNHKTLIRCAGWSCCNLSVGVALNAWFTTNRICAKNNTIYMWREQATMKWSWRVSSAVTDMWMIERNDWRTPRVIAAYDLYCCLLPQCETLRTCHSGFPIAKLKCFHFLKIPDLGSVELTFNIPHHEEPLIREIVTKVM